MLAKFRTVLQVHTLYIVSQLKDAATWQWFAPEKPMVLAKRGTVLVRVFSSRISPEVKGSVDPHAAPRLQLGAQVANSAIAHF